jgi:hypothetical protein
VVAVIGDAAGSPASEVAACALPSGLRGRNIHGRRATLLHGLEPLIVAAAVVAQLAGEQRFDETAEAGDSKLHAATGSTVACGWRHPGDPAMRRVPSAGAGRSNGDFGEHARGEVRRSTDDLGRLTGIRLERGQVLARRGARRDETHEDVPTWLADGAVADCGEAARTGLGDDHGGRWGAEQGLELVGWKREQLLRGAVLVVGESERDQLVELARGLVPEGELSSGVDGCRQGVANGSFGLGIEPFDTPAGVAFTHGGFIPGFMTRVGVIAETGDVFVVAGNDDTRNLDDLVTQIVASWN